MRMTSAIIDGRLGRMLLHPAATRPSCEKVGGGGGDDVDLVLKYSAYLPLQFVCLPMEVVTAQVGWVSGNDRVEEPSSPDPADSSVTALARRALRSRSKGLQEGLLRGESFGPEAEHSSSREMDPKRRHVGLWSKCVRCSRRLEGWSTLAIQFCVGTDNEGTEINIMYVPRLVCTCCKKLTPGDAPYPLLPGVFGDLDEAMSGVIRAFLDRTPKIPTVRRKQCVACMQPRDERRNRKRRKSHGEWVFCSTDCERWYHDELAEAYSMAGMKLEDAKPIYDWVPDYHNYVVSLVSFLRRAKLNINAMLAVPFICSARGCDVLLVKDPDRVSSMFTCDVCHRVFYCSECHGENDAIRHGKSCIPWTDAWNVSRMKDVKDRVCIQ